MALETGVNGLAGPSGVQLAQGRGTPWNPRLRIDWDWQNPCHAPKGTNRRRARCSAMLVRNTSPPPGMAAAGGTSRPDTPAAIDALVQQLAENARVHSGAAAVGLRPWRLWPPVALPALRHRPPHPLRGRDVVERRTLRRRAAPAALGSRADRRPARPRAHRVRRAGHARPGQRRVPARAARRPVHRRRRAAVSAAGRLGARVSAPTTDGGCSTRCCSSSTSGTRRSTTPSTSSSPTSRARPAVCGTSRRPGISGCCKPGGTEGELERAARQLHEAEDFLPARPLDSAPRERPRRQRPDPRAAGKSRRDVRLRGPAVAAARRSADGRVLPPRAGVVARARPGPSRGHAARRA